MSFFSLFDQLLYLAEPTCLSVVQLQIVELVPHLAEACAIATELGKNKDFAIEVVSAFDPKTGDSVTPKVKVCCLR